MSKLIILTVASLTSIVLGFALFVGDDQRPEADTSIPPEPGRCIIAVARNLTPIETTGLVFVDLGPAWYLCRAADPRLKPVLHEILADGTLKNSQIATVESNAITILAYIGDGKDAHKLADRVKTEYAGVLTSWDRMTVTSTFRSLGIMSRRGIDEAGDILDAMLTRGYWESTDFRFFPGNMKSVARDRVEQLWPDLMIAQAYSERPGLEQKVATVLADAHNDQARTELEWQLQPQRLRHLAANQKVHEKRPITQDALDGLRRLYERHRHKLPAKAVELLQQIAAQPPLAEDELAAKPLSRAEQIQWSARRFSVNAEGHVVTLELVGDQATNAVLADLHLFPHLESLSLSVAPVTDRGLRAVSRLSHLKRFTLFGAEHVTDRGVGHVTGLPALEELLLSDLPQVSDGIWGPIGRQRNLRVIEVVEIPLDDDALTHLKSLEQLERLSIISAQVRGPGLENLAGLTNLKGIVLKGVPLTDEGLEHLKSMKSLERITLGDTDSKSRRMQISDAAIEELRQALPDAQIAVHLRRP